MILGGFHHSGSAPESSSPAGNESAIMKEKDICYLLSLLSGVFGAPQDAQKAEALRTYV